MTHSPETYQKYKEAVARAQRKYYLKNREKKLAAQKKYDDEHREQIRARKQTKSKPATRVEIKTEDASE
ncbi:hypothetical protein ON010_g6178 [Phytophthora cinnamomi]|nr:hypothetical protein ON010_g6178 [Phytophthora cinnamomi]